MAWPTDQIATGDLVTAAQWNRLAFQLANETLSANDADFDFTSIPAHWSHLLLILNLRGTQAAAAVDCRVRFNNDSATNYSQQRLTGSGATASAATASGADHFTAATVAGDSATADETGSVVIWIPNYAGSTFKKLALFFGGKFDDASVRSGLWAATPAAVNRVTAYPSAGNWKAGSRATLYGMGRI